MSEVQANSRRLAAILSADVAGYSRLVGDDEEGAVRHLKSARAEIVDPAIAGNHGRIVNTAGDSVLAEFGSVVDAVRAALAVQAGMAQHNAPERPDRRVEFRIAVHLGDVMVQPDGDLLGDGVNIAARLQAVAAPGGVVLSEDAFRQVEGKVEASFAEIGPQRLKNIAHPVRAYATTSGNAARARLPPSREPRRRRSPLRLAIFFVGLALVIFVARAAPWYFGKEGSPPKLVTAFHLAAHEPPRFSIVILPFANLSGDTSQDYFADGITENLTTDLSRGRGMFVIARNTAFTYKGKDVDAKDIGKELNVRYVLEGSVQRDQNRVRVNAQLIDTSSGAHIWAERFDEDRGDLFKLEDKIVARLTNALGYELAKAETERSAHSRNPDSIDLALRGASLSNDSQMGSDQAQVARARELFERALKLDPDNFEALVGAAWLDVDDIAYGRGNPAQIKRAVDLLDRAIAAAPDQAQPYVAKAMLSMVTRRTQEAGENAARALRLDPNNPNVYAALGWTQTLSGRDQDALANIDKAVALSPRDPNLGFWLYLRGSALIDLKRYDEAIAAEQQSIEAHFTGWPAYLALAVAHALKGDTENARAAIATVRKLNPRLSIKSLGDSIDLPPAYNEGLRKAGLPEG